MENSEKFLNIFKKLERYLKKLVNKPSYISFTNLVNAAAKINPTVSEYANDLWELAELRNGIVHDSKNRLLAEVSDFAIDLTQKIYQQITNPPTPFAIATKQVYCCQIDDFLLEQIKIMKEKTFTHVPVYETKKFIGILSESSIFNWLGDTTKINYDWEDMKVGDIKKYLDVDNRPNEYFEFVAKDTNVYSIKQWFTEAIKENKRLGAVFITENGKPNGKMLGIITAWDLSRIKEIAL